LYAFVQDRSPAWPIVASALINFSLQGTLEDVESSPIMYVREYSFTDDVYPQLIGLGTSRNFARHTFIGQFWGVLGRGESRAERQCEICGWIGAGRV